MSYTSRASLIHTAPLPKLNVSLYEALVTELPRYRDILDFVRADTEYVNEIVRGVSMLTQSNEIDHAVFPGNNMIYRRLIVYIFAHVMLCSRDKSFLDEFKQKWKNQDNFDILRDHQSVKDTLSDIFRHRLQVQSYPTLHSEEEFRKLVAIDTIGLCAQLTIVVTDNSNFKKVLAQRGPEAQVLLNLLQARLDFPLDPLHKSRHVKALLELSRASGLYPDCLALRGVEMEEFPVVHGGYGDVYKGTWQGKLIAVKVMKMYQTSDIVKLLKAFSSEAVLWRQLSHPNVLPGITP